MNEKANEKANERVIEAVFNPVRMRILQQFLQKETQTVKRLGEELPHIPPASLYRHVNRLVEDGMIEVCAEYKIRGTVEKVYRLKVNPFIKYNSIDLYLKEEECEELLQAINEVFAKYSKNRGEEEQALYRLSFALVKEGHTEDITDKEYQ